MKALLAAVVILVSAVIPTVVAYSAAGIGQEQPAPLGPGLVTVTVHTHYSRFSEVLDDLRVWEGTLVRFVLVNDDPIHHELIIGPPSVHARHEKGHDMFHPPIPGEVSVGPGQTGLTTYLFDQPGEVRFACHLPGHMAYGMWGDITVVPAPAGRRD